MAATAFDIFTVGLRNAHAMEVQARELMERQSERLDDYPEVKEKLAEHLGETNQQIERLDKCLEMCGESSSMIKDAAQSVMANSMAIAHTMAGDEILKNTFANNAFENFEVAAYRSLLALCDQAGHADCRPMLQQSLAEEEQMAKWVAASVEKITAKYLATQLRA